MHEYLLGLTESTRLEHVFALHNSRCREGPCISLGIGLLAPRFLELDQATPFSSVGAVAGHEGLGRTGHGTVGRFRMWQLSPSWWLTQPCGTAGRSRLTKWATLRGAPPTELVIGTVAARSS
jgi:hypothetical protein